jgi:hypothetical protein
MHICQYDRSESNADKYTVILGRWRDAPCRSQRHFGYADEDRRIMAAVARHILSIVEGTETSNVINLR